MARINTFTLKVRKDGRGAWSPLTVQMLRPTYDESPDSLLAEASRFDTPEQAREAKGLYLQEHPGIECRIFKTVKDETGEIEDINVDALLEDRD